MKSRLGKRNGTSAPRLQISSLPQNNYRSGERKGLSSSPTILQVSISIGGGAVLIRQEVLKQCKAGLEDAGGEEEGSLSLSEF